MIENLTRVLKNPIGGASALFIALLGVISVLGPLLYPVEPTSISLNNLGAPSPENPLGTDDLGRDVLAGMVAGIDVSLTVGIAAALTATVIGITIGSIAGYIGGWIDTAIMRLAEFFQVMPTFILAVLIVAIIGPGLVQIVIIIALLSWPQTARVARGEVLRVTQLDFVSSVRCLGVPPWRILLLEIVPNAIGPAIALATLIMADAILLEASLSFLGLSAPNVISWGRMLSIGQNYVFTAWWLSVFPGLAIFLTVLAFNLLGDALGDALNPRRAR